jgi:Nif-specific regulatory protein
MATDGQRIATLERLLDVALLLNATLPLDDLLAVAVDATQDLLDVELASLLLLDNEADELVIRISKDVAEQRIRATEGIAGWTVNRGEAVIVADVAADARFSGRVGHESGVATRNLLAAPLLVKGGCVGVLEAINKRGGRPFDDDDLRTAQAFAALAAVAVENALMYARLTDAVEQARLHPGAAAWDR